MKTISPRLLSTEVASVLRQEILTGELKAGERLVESSIASTLGVSRGPVREAFKLLRAEGLIGEEPNRGAFVISLTEVDVREIYDLRAALEGRAARLLARRHDGSDAAILKALVDTIVKAALSGNAGTTYAADLVFHTRLMELTGNRRLLESFNRTVPVLRALIPLDEFSYQSLPDIAEEHLPLVRAIEAGAEDEAARLAEQHVESGGAHVCRAISQRAESNAE
jgi:GntR family transcriptional regulator, gluconate operon transcriptional repressor